MSETTRSAWAVAAACGAVGWVLLPVTLARQELGDVLSVDALAILLLAVAWPRGRVAALSAYVLLCGWEVVRGVGAALMDQDPLLYDLSYLLRHFVVLGRDLLGGAFVPFVVVVLASLAVAVAVGAWLLDRGRRGPPSTWVGIALAVALVGWAAGGPVRFSAVALGHNLVQSAQVRGEVASMVDAPAYDAYGGLTLEAAPDLHVYIVESYGRILLGRSGPRARWEAEAVEHQEALKAAGLHSVSGFLTAPVSGGRSWLADATLLTGRPIAHESVFNEVMGRVDGMTHLPGVLASAGYETVLVRPKDRARPGVRLRNDLAFERPVFFADLGYEGRPLGWGIIPDQYTLGWLREHALGASGRPRFVFAHLVSSHAPWNDLPEAVDDWRSLGQREGAAEVEDHGVWEELMIQLGRYQRRDGHRGKRRANSDHLQRYGDAVSYDLDVLTRHLLALPDRPGVFVLMGDHQPPLVARQEDFDVPVHVVATDPELLEPFRQNGFTPGWRLPADGQPALRMEGLMSLLLHAAAAADGELLPVWPDGP